MTTAYEKGFEDGTQRFHDERAGRVQVDFFKLWSSFAADATASGRISNDEAERYQEGFHSGFLDAAATWSQENPPEETGIIPKDEDDSNAWNSYTDPPRD